MPAALRPVGSPALVVVAELAAELVAAPLDLAELAAVVAIRWWRRWCVTRDQRGR